LKAWEIYTADIFGEHPCVLVSNQARSLICVSNSSRNFSSPRHQPRRIGLNSSPSSVLRRSFTYQYQELTPFRIATRYIGASKPNNPPVF
jgi:hypothetical protein